MPNILLIPTSIECSVIEPYLRQRIPAMLAPNNAGGHGDPTGAAAWKIKLCGFGLVAAAANTARFIEQYRPARILLAGIAGNHDDTLVIGTAYGFSTVTCHGIGVGDALSSHHRSPHQLGWKQYESNLPDSSIGETVQLKRRWSKDAAEIHRHLLSVTAASANPAEADIRKAIFLDAAAEDMEGFAVAMACEIAGVGLEIVRGISNRAGDRNHDRWQIQAALCAAAEKSLALMRE